jgi:hypothetical protein
VMRDGFAPVRLCMFVHPVMAYADQPVELEVVLANEDVLKPGTYPVRLRVHGEKGIVWEKLMDLTLPAPKPGELPPLAVPVWKGEVVLLPGKYTWAAELLQGANPAGGKKIFRVAEAQPKVNLPPVTGINLSENIVTLLHVQDVDMNSDSDPAVWRKIVLVGLLPGPDKDPQIWQALENHAKAGGRVVMIDPASSLTWGDKLPFGKTGKMDNTWQWLYHHEVIAKPHALWAGLPAKGLLDWDIFGPAFPRMNVISDELPEDLASASFAIGYCIRGGYISGFDYGGYKIGEGWVYFNTFWLVESVGKSPISDRMLLNMIVAAAEMTGN